jgi:hypothetical protein
LAVGQWVFDPCPLRWLPLLSRGVASLSTGRASCDPKTRTVAALRAVHEVKYSEKPLPSNTMIPIESFLKSRRMPSPRSSCFARVWLEIYASAPKNRNDVAGTKQFSGSFLQFVGNEYCAFHLAADLSHPEVSTDGSKMFPRLLPPSVMQMRKLTYNPRTRMRVGE